MQSLSVEPNTKSGFFNKLINIFFPITKNERKKFLLMCSIMFGILYIYGTLRSMRDSIIVTELGSIYLTFIELYFVCPTSILFSIFYAKITNVMRREYIYYTILTFFLISFLAFGLVIYPNIELYHMSDERITELTQLYPNFQYFIVLIGKWGFTFFGVLVEMWTPVVFIILYWQYANHVIDSDQARRFYPSFGIIGNSSYIFSGQLIKMTTVGTTKYEFVYRNIIVVAIFIVFIMIMFYVVNRYISIIYNKKKDVNNKLSLPIKDSIKLILKSNYLRYIFFMIIGYGIINNILEIQWKTKVRELYSDTNQYAHFMGDFTILSGFTLVILSVISSNVIRKAKWRTAAKIPAFIALIACVSFYPLNVLEHSLSPMMNHFIGSYLQLLCTVSTVAIILMKCSKYTFFDNTREMVYIPLDAELKVKGKAVVDLLGSKITIAGGSFLQSSILMIFPLINMKLYSGILGCVSIVMAIIWIYAINRLSSEYNKLLSAEKDKKQSS